ncbi:MAG: MerR family transcriptional regulator [Deltaproteobacteria bacterium]|nr:MerR family transcriptional regulator [Deltaproteobacteria bacterium]
MRPLVLPDKLFFRIGEAADLLGVKPHVIRYWETEFRSIRPAKSRTGQRVYSRRDLEVLALVRNLLHEKRYTIDGARKVLRERGIEGALGEARQDRETQGAAAAQELRRSLNTAAQTLTTAAARLESPLPSRKPSAGKGHEGVAKTRRSE